MAICKFAIASSAIGPFQFSAGTGADLLASPNLGLAAASRGFRLLAHFCVFKPGLVCPAAALP
jgi:hypothetical protein